MKQIQALGAPRQRRGAAVTPGTKKKVAIGGEEKNRRALGDIGNLVVARDADGKVQPRISCPDSSRVAALQLRENTQAATLDKKPAAIPAKVRVIDQKVAAKPPIAEIIEINSENESSKHTKPSKVTEISSDESATSSRRKIHTLTSVLVARSKVACEVQGIDELDAGNELAVIDYVEDIYSFYKFAENCSRPRDYIGCQEEINAKIRSILVDWLIEVHHKFELMPETLYLTMHVIDRYLSVEMVSRRELQLVGLSSMLIACKYEEVWAPPIDDFLYIIDCEYSREQILDMEKAILNKLEWNLTVPTPYVFLVRFLKAAMADKEMEDMVFFFAELGLMRYSLMIEYCPSLFAATAVYAARCTLECSPPWTEALKQHSGYCQMQLLDCARSLATIHASGAESKLKTGSTKLAAWSRGLAHPRCYAANYCLEGFCCGMFLAEPYVGLARFAASVDLKTKICTLSIPVQWSINQVVLYL